MEMQCKGSYVLGSACGRCSRCAQDPARPDGLPVDQMSPLFTEHATKLIRQRVEARTALVRGEARRVSMGGPLLERSFLEGLNEATLTDLPLLHVTAVLDTLAAALEAIRPFALQVAALKAHGVPPETTITMWGNTKVTAGDFYRAGALIQEAAHGDAG